MTYQSVATSGSLRHLIRWNVRLFIILICLTYIIYFYLQSNGVYIMKGQSTCNEITDLKETEKLINKSSKLETIWKSVPINITSKITDLKEKERVIKNRSKLENIRKSVPKKRTAKILQNSGRDSFSNDYKEKKMRRLPQAIIFGVKKCGTHALTDMISLHPQVEHLKHYEMHFFEKSRKTGSDKRYKKGLKWYQNQMPPTYENQITMEKTPSYFISADAPQRIYDMNSSIKLILIVRDPTTRVVSDYIHSKDMNEIDGLKTFEEEVLKPNGEVDKWSYVVTPSLYAHYMERWLLVFNRNQILIVDGGKIISDPLSEITRVEKFLNLSPYVKQDNLYWNPEKRFYCMRSQVKEWCLRKTKGRPHPEMNPKVMSKLRRFFAPLNERFYKMVGHNFSWPTA